MKYANVNELQIDVGWIWVSGITNWRRLDLGLWESQIDVGWIKVSGITNRRRLDFESAGNHKLTSIGFESAGICSLLTLGRPPIATCLRAPWTNFSSFWIWKWFGDKLYLYQLLNFSTFQQTSRKIHVATKHKIIILFLEEIIASAKWHFCQYLPWVQKVSRKSHQPCLGRRV